MSTPRPQTAEDKLAAMFEKMIDDFCETHGPDEIEAMFAKCDAIFDGIEKRHKEAEGVAAPLEPSRQEFVANLEHEWLDQQSILDFRNWLIEKLWTAAAVSKNVKEAYDREHAWLNNAATEANCDLNEVAGGVIQLRSRLSAKQAETENWKRVADERLVRALKVEEKLAGLEKEIAALRETK